MEKEPKGKLTYIAPPAEASDKNDEEPTPTLPSIAAVASTNLRQDLLAAVQSLRALKPELPSLSAAVSFVMNTPTYKRMPDANKFKKTADAVRHTGQDKENTVPEGKTANRLMILTTCMRAEIANIHALMGKFLSCVLYFSFVAIR